MSANTNETETRFESWFMHDELLLSLLSAGERADVERQLPGPNDPLSAARRASILGDALNLAVTKVEIVSVDEELMKHRLRTGQLVWLEQALAFKGVRAALDKVKAGDPAFASFSSALATDKGVRVTGRFNVQRLTSHTAETMLSGTRRVFVMGYVQERSDAAIDLRPIIIATRWYGPASNWLASRLVDQAHVLPNFVDQFGGVDFSQRISKSELNVLKGVSEQQVKEGFASIIGEPTVPNDWGGEQFDLWTPRGVSVDGVPLRSAFLFKGPARFHPMTIADLGQNGDQIDRLFQTPADLVVVQHCHSMTAPVVNMLKTYATHPRNLKRYMTIDGYDTLRILRISVVCSPTSCDFLHDRDAARGTNAKPISLASCRSADRCGRVRIRRGVQCPAGTRGVAPRCPHPDRPRHPNWLCACRGLRARRGCDGSPDLCIRGRGGSCGITSAAVRRSPSRTGCSPSRRDRDVPHGSGPALSIRRASADGRPCTRGQRQEIAAAAQPARQAPSYARGAG